MDLMNLLKSVEELLYEIVSWLVFYPLTFWRAVRHPMTMMAYAEAEIGEKTEARYDDALSPPIFLFLTLLLAHLFELRFGMAEAQLTGALADQRNLLLFRAVMFSFFPLMIAVQRVRRVGRPLTRASLRPAFYSQCYVAAPFALSFDVSMILIRSASGWMQAVSAAILVAGLVWYVCVETRWFSLHGGVGAIVSFLRVIATVFAGMVFFVVIALLSAPLVLPV